MKRFSYIFLVLTAANAVMPAHAATAAPTSKSGLSWTGVAFAALAVAFVAYRFWAKPSESKAPKEKSLGVCRDVACLGNCGHCRQVPDIKNQNATALSDYDDASGVFSKLMSLF